MSIPPAVYGNLATLVVLAHFAFILFVMFGGLLVLRWRWVLWLQLPCFLWGGYVELSGSICPLTPLENRLRGAAGVAQYAGGFIERYILPVVYPPGLTRGAQLTLAVGLVALNLGIYLWVVARWKRGRRG